MLSALQPPGWLWLLEAATKKVRNKHMDSDLRLAFELDHIMTFTTIRALTGLQLGPGTAPRFAWNLRSRNSRGFR